MGLSKERMYEIEYWLDRADLEQLAFIGGRIAKKVSERKENLEQTRFGNLNSWEWL